MAFIVSLVVLLNESAWVKMITSDGVGALDVELLNLSVLPLFIPCPRQTEHPFALNQPSGYRQNDLLETKPKKESIAQRQCWLDFMLVKLTCMVLRVHFACDDHKMEKDRMLPQYSKPLLEKKKANHKRYLCISILLSMVLIGAVGLYQLTRPDGAEDDSISLLNAGLNVSVSIVNDNSNSFFSFHDLTNGNFTFCQFR